MNSNETQNCLVIGSGVSGLTTALHLLTAGHKVTVISREAAHSSAHAYAMWVPVRGADPRLERWAYESLAQFTALAAQPGTGVTMRPLFVLQSHNSPDPWYSNRTHGFRRTRPGEISQEYVDAFVIDQVPVIDPPVYLAWLRQRVTGLGAVFLEGSAQLDAIAPTFDAVINCTSLGARELAGEQDIYPERMQVLTIRRPAALNADINRVIIDDEGPNKRACIVPHEGYIKLGAVFDGPVEDLTVDDAATADILARCNKMVPGLNAQIEDVLTVTRALRPERAQVRVEKDSLNDGRPVIHNYGHDGMGYILSHGIAGEIASLV